MGIFEALPKQKVTTLLVVIVIVLTTISFSLGAIISEQMTDSSFVKQLLTLFNLDGEANIPTWFATFLLCFNGLIMFIIAYRRKWMEQGDVLYWLILGIIFLILSIDEFVKLHEITIRPLREALGTSGGLYYAWVIPGGIFVAIIGLLYFPFLFRLPTRTRNLIIIAGIIYVLGAIGMEILGGLYTESIAPTQVDTAARGLGYVVLVNIEETLEKVGLIILFHGLISYMDLLMKDVKAS